MRRLVAPVLLSLLTGCYLFSDEPKARKKSGSAAAEPSADASAAKPAAEPTPPQPEGQTNDCPAVLTGTETAARTIASGCAPVRVRGQYRIDGGTLTLEPGVELRFEQGAVLEVGRDRPGTLTIAGTLAQPVRLVADMVGDVGGWQGVRLHAQASGSSLKHVEIASAGTETEAALWIATEQLSVEQLRIRSAPALALELVAERAPTLLGVTLTGTGTVARVSPSGAAALQELSIEPTAFVAVTSGKLASTLEWPATRYRIEGVIRIEGDAERPAGLSLAPGASLLFTPEARLIVGGFGPGSLSASAAVDAPDGKITLRAADDDRPGAWSGVHVQDQGELNLRNVALLHGGAGEEGVILAEGTAKLSVEGCELRDNLVGVELRGHAVTLESFANNEFFATPVAVKTTPTLLAGLGPDNRYDELAQIDVERGKIEADASWAAQAAPIRIHGDVFVDNGATLSVAPGSRLGFDAGVVLGVGYYAEASLDLRGTADAPILLEPANPSEPAPWGGVVLGERARKARFEHVQLRNTAGAAGIELRDAAEATLVNVDCADCANATVTWDCSSQIGNIAVTASGTTPTAMAAPSSCM